MNYKQFLKWCNERACDGCWGLHEAIICSRIAETLYELPFWKRNKFWHNVNKDFKIVELFVEPTNKKIEEYGAE